MATMPGANVIGGYHDNGVMSRYDIVCIHTIVGFAPANAAHFSTTWDGHVYQSRDTHYRSAANLNGNYRIIAIENEDSGPAFGNWNHQDGHAVPGFTEAQKEAIARILVWVYHTHQIPLELAPDSRPGSRGVAYHRQGIDGDWSSYQYGGRVSGGEVWTKSGGKVCPGDARISQLINHIIPRARMLAGLEEDMTEAQAKELTYSGWRTYAANAGWEKIPQRADIPQALWNEVVQSNVSANDAAWRTYAVEQGWTIIPERAGIPARLWNEAVIVNKNISELESKVDALTTKLDEVLGILNNQS